MQRIVVDREFALPRERVFAYLAEHENLAALFGAKVTRLNDGTDGTRNGVGSARELKVGPLPPFVETVTEVVLDELIRYRITKGSVLREHEGVMRFSESGSGAGSRLHYEIVFRGVVPGLGRLIAPGLKRNIEKGLGRVEAGA
jgi:uncharacterized protein YndB with AHSA1/START domain